MALTEEIRTPESATVESNEASSSQKTTLTLNTDFNVQRRNARDERIGKGAPYQLAWFAWDFLVYHDVNQANYQQRVDAVSRTEGIIFKDDRAVGDAVIEVVQGWAAVPYSVIDLDPELLERTGLDQLRPRN